MQPIDFPEATRTITAPHGMTDEECGPLRIYTDGKLCVSCWKMTWRERLSALFLGKVWLQVHSGATQPPVVLEASKTIFVTHHHEKSF